MQKTENSEPNMKKLSPPFSLFDEWYQSALKLQVPNPSAMVLATVSEEDCPSARIVLLKEWDENGYVFYTNYQSSKAAEMDANPMASLLFFWDPLGRQIRIKGKVERISRERSESYFHRRPLKSQWGAWASRQSQMLPGRSVLEERFLNIKTTYPDQVPLPDFWGGYLLVPHRFEFWQNEPDRLHQRIIYEKQIREWSSHLLYP